MDLKVKELDSNNSYSINKYDEILANMGIYFENGEMKSIDNFEILTTDNLKKDNGKNLKKNKPKSEIIPEDEKAVLQNSYIYNKYFNDYIKPVHQPIVLPEDPIERRRFLQQKYLEEQKKRQEIARIKSTKMLYNINTTTSANVSRLGSNINFRMF